jgi:hypothetical protein
VASYSEGAETSSTEGETMTTGEMETDSGSDTRSTSLAKRECLNLVAWRYFCIGSAQHAEVTKQFFLLVNL